MASLSEKLRRERELRGISLKQISDDTKIGVRFLEALEEDKPERIPGEFYRRSYLRAYARYLGLDEDRAVNAYAFSQTDSEAEPGTQISRARSVASEPDRAVSWLPWLALGALGLLAGVVFLAFRGDRAPERASAPIRSGSASISAKPEPEESAAAAAEKLAAAVPLLSPRESEASQPREAPPPLIRSVRDGALRLVVSVSESCWLEIESDGEVVTTGLKQAGYRREIVADEEVRLWLGNAGGVSLSVNGRPLKPLGRLGQVRKDLAITPDNFMDFVGDDVS